MPPGARYDSLTATLRWTPGLDQAAVYEVELYADKYGETGILRIGVADKYDDPANVPVVDPLRYPEEFGLPVIFVSFTGTPIKGESIPADVVYRGKKYSAELRKHGEASLLYPKNTYGLKFPSDDLFQEPAHGMPNRRRIRLTTTFDDNSYIRPRIAMAMWERMNPKAIPLKGYNAVFYMNGSYYGLYVINDNPDKQLLELGGVSREGNLYKVSSSSSGNFGPLTSHGEPKPTMHYGYQKEEGMPPEGSPGAFDDLDAFVSFVINASAEEFAARLPGMVELDEFANWWLFAVCLTARDNTNRNYFLYHDPYVDGPWRFVPWDLSGSLGQRPSTVRVGPEIETYEDRNNLFKRMLAEPSFRLRERMHEAVRGAWSEEEILRLIDRYAAEVERSALRDEAKWGAIYRTWNHWEQRTDFTDFRGEIAYMKGWVRDHWAVLRGAY